MTVLVVINCGNYSLLAADQRTTASDGSYEDGFCKITEVDMGFITGYGWVELLQDVKEEIKKANPKTIEDILFIINKNQLNLRIKYPFALDFNKWVEGTSWTILYKNKTKVKTAYYSKQLNNFIEIQTPTFISHRPKEMDESTFNAFSQHLKNNFKSSIDNDSYVFNIGLLNAFIEEFSKHCSTVSPKSDIAVLDINGQKHLHRL